MDALGSFSSIASYIVRMVFVGLKLRNTDLVALGSLSVLSRTVLNDAMAE